MTVREAAVAAPQTASTGTDPHGGAGVLEDRTPITVAQWRELHPQNEGWPMVFSEDLETACEYCPGSRGDCDGACLYTNPDAARWVPVGPVPGEPEYDENYWDAKKDDLI